MAAYEFHRFSDLDRSLVALRVQLFSDIFRKISNLFRHILEKTSKIFLQIHLQQYLVARAKRHCWACVDHSTKCQL